jgi:hypothetical protein
LQVFHIEPDISNSKSIVVEVVINLVRWFSIINHFLVSQLLFYRYAHVHAESDALIHSLFKNFTSVTVYYYDSIA